MKINMENTSIMRNPAYHETKQHTDAMFAFNIYPCTIPADFSFVPLHWHDNMEIIYVKQGSGLVQIDFTTYTAKAGDVFLIQPGHMHGIQHIPKSSMKYENLIFDMSFLGSGNIDLCSQKYLIPIINGSIQLPACIKKDNELCRPVTACLDTIDHLCADHANGYELNVKGHLMILFSLLIPTTERQKAPASNFVSRKNMQRLKTVLSRVESDYNKKLTINDIADECGYSASHFMRWFKDATGLSFTKYLIEYRLSKAASELRDTNRTILDISERNGFDNLSNFNRLFKSKFDMTPSRFRHQNFEAFSDR